MSRLPPNPLSCGYSNPRPLSGVFRPPPENTRRRVLPENVGGGVVLENVRVGVGPENAAGGAVPESTGGGTAPENVGGGALGNDQGAGNRRPSEAGASRVGRPFSPRGFFQLSPALLSAPGFSYGDRPWMEPWQVASAAQG
ncbi:hypothetical protein GCM10017600_32390 [Streptosporangium carneum]|uniref:Uncharacterized protein n=1 Tax=Streptosporangium carneum TaxID=47481 RepID=A0A9W6I254_9ACTN|nr:hypothetical protein GCM10017600_32390 [Streptosporangium carneum]